MTLRESVLEFDDLNEQKGYEEIPHAFERAESDSEAPTDTGLLEGVVRRLENIRLSGEGTTNDQGKGQSIDSYRTTATVAPDSSGWLAASVSVTPLGYRQREEGAFYEHNALPDPPGARRTKATFIRQGGQSTSWEVESRVTPGEQGQPSVVKIGRAQRIAS